MAQLFISYSTRNADFARYLRGLLQDAGFDVWMDEARLSAGQSWTDTLEANIRNCAAFVIIMSPESKASDWVRRERLLAERLHKPIFPILFSGEAWWDLANIQYEDMRAGLRATLAPRLIEALRQAVNGEAPVSQTEPTGTHNPVPAISRTDARKLEAAMPAETRTESDTEVWAKISLPNSEGLRGELPAAVPSGDVIQKGDARASTFPIRFPVDPRSGQLLPAQAELRLSSGDFVVAAPGERIEIEIPPDADSRTVIFTLEANPERKKIGRSRIVIDLIYDAKIIAQISVSTVLVERVTAAVPTWNLAALGYSLPGAATTAPAGAALDDALRGAPSLAAPITTAEIDDADEVLPTYEEKALKEEANAASSSSELPAPQYSGSATRAAYDENDAMPAKRAPRQASSTPLRLASLFAALALVFVVVLTITRQKGTSDAGPLSTLTNFTSAVQGTSQTIILPSGVVLQAVAVAPMVDCSGTPGAEMVHLLRDAGLSADLLDAGFTSERAARAQTGYTVVVWGACSRGLLALNVELMTIARQELAAPQVVVALVAPETLAQANSHAVRLVRAITDYARGDEDNTALAQIFENLTREASSEDERAALRTLWANSLYYAGQYNAATQVYR